MKYLKEKTEIVKFMNTHQCIRINLETPEVGYDTIFKGDLVKLICPTKSHPDLTLTGELTYYSKEDKFYVSNAGAMLKASFGYSDVMDKLKEAQAPVLKEGDLIAVVCDYPKDKQCSVRVMKATRINSMYFESCVLEDVE